MMSRYLVTDQYGPYKGLWTKCTGSSPRSRAKKPCHVSSEYKYGLLTSISCSGTDQGSRCASALKSMELRGATGAFIGFSSRSSRWRRRDFRSGCALLGRYVDQKWRGIGSGPRIANDGDEHAVQVARASPPTPFPLFDRLFLNRVVLVEADESLDVVAGGDAFLGAEAGKITARLELGKSALGEVKADEQVEKRVEGDLVAHIGELGCADDRTVVAVAAAHDINQRDLRQLRRLL